jgi:hypothetical protein
MYGLSKAKIRQIISTKLPSNLEDDGVKKITDAIIDGVSEAIEENNEEFVKRLKAVFDLKPTIYDW